MWSPDDKSLKGCGLGHLEPIKAQVDLHDVYLVQGLRRGLSLATFAAK